MKKVILSLAFILSTAGAFAAQESRPESRMVLAAQATTQLSQQYNLTEDQQKILSARLNEIAESNQGFIDRDVAQSIAEGIQALPTQAGPANSSAKPWQIGAPISVGEVEEKEESEELSGEKLVGGKKSKPKPGDSQKKLKAKSGTKMISRKVLEAMSQARDAKDGGGQLDPKSKLFEQLGGQIASFEPTIVLPWNIQFVPGEVSKVIEGMQGRQIRVSSNGHYLALFTGYGAHVATGARQALIEIWDMQLMQKIKDIAIDTGQRYVTAWALSGAGDKLAFFTENSPSGIILDVQHEAVICSINATPSSIQFTPDGSRLAVQIATPTSGHEWDTSTATYNATTGELLDTEKLIDILPATKNQRSFVFSSDGTKLGIYHRPAPFIDVWDVATQSRLLHLPRNDDREYSSVLLDNSGKKLAVYSIDKVAIEGRKNRYLEIWNTQTGEKIAQIRLTNAANTIALSPDGRILLTANLGSPITAWNLEELEQQYQEAEAKRLAEQ